MCEHEWRKVYEEFLLGGAFPIGWECIHCKRFTSNSDLTPTGLSGKVLKKAMRLIGAHGGRGMTSKGKLYKEQIIDENGELTIIE